MTALLSAGLCALTFASCEYLDNGTDAAEGKGDTTPEEKVDSVRFSFEVEAGHQVRSLEILLYEDTGLRRLCGHQRWSGSRDSLVIIAPEGGKMVIAIANYPYRLNTEALKAYESAELLQCGFDLESIDAPVMSGCASALSGELCTIRLKPLRAEIVLARVRHELEGYTRMEDPIVYLSGVPDSVEILRESGFSPNRTFSDTTGMRGFIWDALPNDIGMYPQFPGTRLYCYPSDEGVRNIEFTLECHIRGTRERFPTQIPPVGRDSKLTLELDVNSDLTYKYTIY